MKNPSPIRTASTVPDPARRSRRLRVVTATVLAFLFAPVALAESWNRVSATYLTHVATGRSDRDVIYGVTSTGGLVRSMDGGTAWVKLSLTPSGPITALATAPANSTTVYVVASGEFWASTDTGQTWTLRSSSLPTACPQAPEPALSLCPAVSLYVDPVDPTHVLVGSSAAYRTSFLGEIIALAQGWGVRTTSDGGRTWAVHPSFPASEAFSFVSSADGGVIYAPGVAGISVSQDRGVTWQAPAAPVVLDYPRSGAVAIQAGSPCTAWATERGTAPTVIATTDCGVTWGPPSDPLFPGRARIDLLDASAVKAGTVVALVSGTLRRTTDGGKIWGPVCEPWRAIFADMLRTDSKADRFLMVNTGSRDLWTWDVAAPFNQGSVRCIVERMPEAIGSPAKLD